MPVDGGRLFKVFLSSLPKGPGSFSYVLFITVEVVTLVAVYDSTFVVLGVLVLGLHEYLFDCSVTLDVNLYTILTTYLFDAFSYSLCIWYETCPIVVLLPLMVLFGLLLSLLLCVVLLLLSLDCVVMARLLLLLLGLVE